MRITWANMLKSAQDSTLHTHCSLTEHQHSSVSDNIFKIKSGAAFSYSGKLLEIYMGSEFKKLPTGKFRIQNQK
jgi:hypothetical protein